MIQGHGNANPKAMFITDSAVTADLQTNYAISGNAQNMLKDLLHDNKLHYGDFYYTCLVKEEFKEHYAKAPKRKKDLLELDKAREVKVDAYKDVLLKEINALKPFVLVPMGELAFKFLTEYQNIRKFRGSVLKADLSKGIAEPVKVLPVLAPYPYLYQDPKMKMVARLDIGKLHNQFNNDPPPDDIFNVWVAKSSSALRSFLERQFYTAKFVTLDIETFKGIPSCISFCFDGKEAVSIPFLHKDIDRDMRVMMMGMVAKVLNSDLPKVNQNIKFDWQILNRWGFKVKNIVGDTMLAAAICYCEFPKNLGFLTSIYTDLPYFKDEGKIWDPYRTQKDRLFLYNAKDALATWQIHEKQQRDVDDLGVRFVHDQTIRLLPLYRIMEDNGIRIDMEQRDKLLHKYESLFRIQCEKLKRLVGREINPQSPLVCGRLIFDELGYNKPPGVKGTDEESLETLLVKGTAKQGPIIGPDVLRTIIAARKVHKVIEILELYLHPDERFRGSTNLAGTETGRTSGGKTIDEIFLCTDKGKFFSKNLGHSLQTIGKHGFAIDGVTYGKDIRSMFVPSYGYVFVECDSSQAEARVDAVLAGNFDMLAVFDSPTGIHRLTGSWVFGCPPEEIKKNILVDGVDRYHLSKTVRHAGERNIKEHRLAMMTQLSVNQCRGILKTFHEYQPEIRETFHRDIRHEVTNHRCLISPNGRRRDFFDRIDESTINQGISQLPQAIVGDNTKFSMIPSSEQAPWARWLYEAHDGLMVEVPKGREMETAEIMNANMSYRSPIDFRHGSLRRDISLIIPAECSISEGSWMDLKEVKVDKI